MMYNDVKSGITALAAGLKVGSEYVYKVLVKQQIIIGLSYLLMYLVFVIIFIIAFKIVLKGYKRINSKDQSHRK